MSNIHELRQQPHWSYSAFQCYLTCPLKFRFQYVDKIKPEHTSSSFPFGRAYHAALSQRARLGQSMTFSDARDAFADYFKAETDAAERLQYKDTETYDSLLLQGVAMLNVALEQWQDDFAVKSVAEGFSVSVPGLSKPLIGEYDMLVEDRGAESIVDWKTSSRKWDVEKAHSDLQATVFCYARTQQTGKSPLFRFDVMTKTKVPNLESHYTERRKQDFQRFELLAQTIESAVEEGIFYPSEGCFSCADCQYKKQCRLWHAQKR